ncbi:MAG TPA: ABC transporter substrate-binding protein [Duganella sp.]|uniref:substrate-binding periplasmic protein n=1 Tax=Duganella sp. TaxID=1904440 RepID=UPI002ED0C1FE
MLPKRFYAPLIACWLLLAAVPAPAATGPVVSLRVAAQAGTDPKFIDAGDGRIIGVCIDIFRTIERIDPGLVFIGDQQWLPLVRAHSEVVNHQHDALCAIQRTPEREVQYNYIDLPLLPLRFQLLARADDPVVIRNWEDVRRLGANGVILTNRGFGTTEALERIGGLRFSASAADPLNNLQKLVARRGRFFLHRGPGLKSFIQRSGYGGKVKILPQVMYQTETYMALGTHVDPAVAARVRHAVEQMERTGELARLLKKWD